MDTTFSHAQIKQLKLAVEQVIDAKFGENIMERIDKIENNTDLACKISSDTQQELILTQAKVDRHDSEIKVLQSVAGFATA